MSHRPGLDESQLAALSAALRELDSAFAALPQSSHAEPRAERIEGVLHETAERLTDNYPYFHPLYAGQMLKPPHPVARLAYMLAMGINPNNHALDGGRASSAMEREVVADLAAMFGFQAHLGHLTSGGTMANLEALWVAGRERPGQVVLASEQAHYTHQRITGVLQLPFETVASDNDARLDPEALEQRLADGGVGCVVATAGTTGFGSVDPIAEIQELCQQYDTRLHVDAAYGGYFHLLADDEEAPLEEHTRRALRAIRSADSVVIDPHKHGLQPYGCGAVLFADPAVGRHYQHDSPYTYFTSRELHLGEISLECSRAGAAAVALWATHRLLPPVPGGEFAADLQRCLGAARRLHERIAGDERFHTLLRPELDIVVWACAGESGTAASRLAQETFDRAAEKDLHLALIRVGADLVAAHTPLRMEGGETLVALRSCLMKPEHEEWVEEIWRVLGECV